jgi:hypothetical protein
MTLEDQIKAVHYEIARRKAVYPKRVAKGKMKPEAAEHEIAAMQAVLESLQTIATARVAMKNAE